MFQDAIIQTKTKRQSSYFINSTLCRYYKYFFINHPTSSVDESGNPKLDRELSKVLLEIVLTKIQFQVLMNNSILTIVH
jgi:hypothetical protein